VALLSRYRHVCELGWYQTSGHHARGAVALAGLFWR
jgi:hypothetical protein